MSKLSGTRVKMRTNRFVLDSYFTPPYATEKLLEFESFDGAIYDEPASGHGHISKVLEEKGHDVISSDFRDDAYGQSKVDFFSLTNPVKNIITNPPYSIATEWIEHGLSIVENKMVLLLRFAFAESQGRHKLMTTTPLSKVLVFSKRLDHWDGNEFIKGGQFTHAWFVWDKNHKISDGTKLHWLI